MKKKSIKVTLPPAFADVVDSLIDTGLYRDAEDVVRGGVLALRSQILEPGNRLQQLREDIAIGIAQADRGELEEWDIEEIKREGRRQLRAAKKVG